MEKEMVYTESNKIPGKINLKKCHGGLKYDDVPFFQKKQHVIF